MERRELGLRGSGRAWWVLGLWGFLLVGCAGSDPPIGPDPDPDPTPVLPEAPSVTVEVPKNGWAETELRAEHPDADQLSYELVSGPDHGTLEVSEAGPGAVRLRYTPDAGFDGEDRVVYRVSAGEVSDEGEVTLRVRNTTPEVEGALVRRPTDRGVTVRLTAVDRDGDPLDVAVATPPGNGSVVSIAVVEETPEGVSAEPSSDLVTGAPEPSRMVVELRYEPEAGFPGPDWFTLTVSDGSEVSEPARVEIEPNRPPELPEAGAAGAVEVEGRRGEALEVLIRAVSPFGDPLAFTVTRAPEHGTLAPFQVREVSAAAGSAAGVSGAAASASAAATSAAAASGAGGTAGGASTTHSAHQSGPLTFEATTTYSPGQGFAGKDGFGFSMTDGLESFPGEVEITVVNRPPSADPVEHAAPRSAPIELILSGRDPDGHPLTFQVVEGPSHGTLGTPAVGATTPGPDGSAITTATILYTPGPNPERSGTFRYLVHDGVDASEPAEVVVTLENSVPAARSQETSVGRNQSVTLTIEADDADGDPLTFLVAVDPEHGTLGELTPAAVTPLSGGAARSSATVLYTPGPGFAGADRLVFSAHDGLDRSGPGEVLLTVTNEAPEATAPDPVTTPFETPVTVTLSGTDADGDELLFLLPEAAADGYPAHGTLGGLTRTGPATATVVYTPGAGFSGADTFTFRVSDGLIGSDNVATVSLTVDPHPNQPPVADDPGTVITSMNTPVDVVLTGSDPDGDPLTFEITAGPDHGTLGAVTPTGSTSATVTYTPQGGYIGGDQFTFRVSDGGLESQPVTVQIAQDNAVLTATPALLTLTAGSGVPGTVTITNASATASAHGVVPAVPVGTGVSVGGAVGCNLVAPGASCEIELLDGGTAEAPTTFEINANDAPGATFQVEVALPPATLAVTGSPLVLAANDAAQSLTVTNTSTMTTAANLGSNFAGTALDGHVTETGNTCAVLPPGDSCMLTFSPGATQVPLTAFLISGDGTAAVNAELAVLGVGSPWEGGIVFQIGGGSGLIAAAGDNSTAIEWGGYGTFTGAVSGTDGAANTQTIVDVLGVGTGYAARLCWEDQTGGFTDWFLPAREQMDTLFDARVVVGGFAQSAYWNSSDFNALHAWSHEYFHGAQVLLEKFGHFRVRCIRSFTY